jgi:hypothetical protein
LVLICLFWITSSFMYDPFTPVNYAHAFSDEPNDRIYFAQMCYCIVFK